jgi:hypothetical protein
VTTDDYSLGVMKPGHLLWPVFCQLLETACEFHAAWEPEPGYAFAPGADGEPGTAWRCPGERNRPRTVGLLRMMGASTEEVLAALDHYDEHGGHCDCEILFNVEASDTGGDSA